MTMPGIGPVTALAYRATIDDPKRAAGPGRLVRISVSLREDTVWRTEYPISSEKRLRFISWSSR
ncbi:MAG: hypothetical protein EOR33_32080 [Mesorhizobium sp.]|nr:MAG: hypothetical protein EOR33_32080 [Mesorhizobium sp.]